MTLPQPRSLATGNDYLSVPSVRPEDLAVAAVSVLSGQLRGAVEFLGGPKGEAFFAPFLKVGSQTVDLAKLKQVSAGREDFWTPTWTGILDGEWELKLRLVCPPNERGLFLDLRLKNLSAKKPLKAQLGAQGVFGGLGVRRQELEPMRLWRRVEREQDKSGLVLSAGSVWTRWAWAVDAPEGLDHIEIGVLGQNASKEATLESEAVTGKALRWTAAKDVELAPGAEARLGLVLGAGLDVASARAVCGYFKRKGLGPLSSVTRRFLEQRRRHTGDDVLDQVLNQNLFYSLFFGTGLCLDTEQFVAVRSRASDVRYSDRDALLWAFPALLLVDPQRARKALVHAFGTQAVHAGAAMRDLSGGLSEPGVSLDALCAPVIALQAYVKQGNDQGLLKDWSVREGLRRFERSLNQYRHANVALYASEADPPKEALAYRTLDNVLVWKAQLALADIKDRQGRGPEAGPHKDQAERLRQALLQRLVSQGPRGRVYAVRSDLWGRNDHSDESGRGLRLLPYYGFAGLDDGLWRASLGEAQTGSLLGLADALLGGAKDSARPALLSLALDSNLHAASEAGFMAMAIHRAFGKTLDQARYPKAVAIPRGAMGQVSMAPPAPVPQPRPTGDPKRGAIAPLRPGPVLAIPKVKAPAKAVAKKAIKPKPASKPKAAAKPKKKAAASKKKKR